METQKQKSIDQFSEQELKDLVFQAAVATKQNEQLIELVFNEINRRVEKARFDEEMAKSFNNNNRNAAKQTPIVLPRLKNLTRKEDNAATQNELSGSF